MGRGGKVLKVQAEGGMVNVPDVPEGDVAALLGEGRWQHKFHGDGPVIGDPQVMHL